MTISDNLVRMQMHVLLVCGALTPVPGPLLALHDVPGAEHLPLQQVGAPPRLRDLAPVADVCNMG